MQVANLRRPSASRIAGTLATIAALGLPLLAQGSITGIGYGVNNVICTGMSADTHAIVGYATGATGGASRWITGAADFTLIGLDSGGMEHISDNGLYIASSALDPTNGNAETAARWSAVTNAWQLLGGLGGQSGTSRSAAHDISRDGQTVVGLGWISAGVAHGFRWTPSAGMVDLGSFTGFTTSSNAFGVSADGTVIVGWDNVNGGSIRRAVRWVNLVESQLGSLDPTNPVNGQGEAYGASSNGTWIVGTSQGKAFRWSAATGMQSLGQLAGATARGYSVSDDGKMVVGWSGASSLDAKAIIWTPSTGVMELQQYLLNFGLGSAANWNMRNAIDVSSDGTKIAVHCYNTNNIAQPVLVDLPVPVPTVYCTAGTTTNGCTPAISATHNPSLTGAFSCSIDVTGVEGQKTGIIFYGLQSTSAPWASGSTSLLCVKAPSQRTGVQASGGTLGSCDGTFSLNWDAYQTAHPSALGQPWTLGNKAYVQGWFRDPPAPKTTNLSNAIELSYLP
jgi:probable HAF family extracellular repeat protein